jgi:hypothetical protein
MNEIWRPIAGRDGYEVSDLGRVRSLPRIITRIRRGRTERCFYKGRVLRQGRARNGYLTVSLSGRSVNVHTVVLRAFRGESPPGYQAAHYDGEKSNNSLANLRWASRSENEADKRRHGTYLAGVRTHNGRKTTCKRGHIFDSRNTRFERGWRACRACQRDRDREARRAERARRAAA